MRLHPSPRDLTPAGLGRPFPRRALHSLVWLTVGCALLATLPGLAGEGGAAAGTTIGGVYDLRTQLDRVERDRIVVRFAPETGARVRQGELVSLNGTDLSGIRQRISGLDGAQLFPRFPAPEEQLDELRRRGEERTRQALPDLNLFALVRLPELRDTLAARERLRDALAQLNGAPGVAGAWAVPLVYPATEMPGGAPAEALSGTSGTGGNVWSDGAGGAGSARFARSDTPDFSPLQGYLYAPPSGVWADSAWSFPGGTGMGVKVLSLEWGWLFTHEDLKPPFYLTHDQGPSDHGTAVAGIYGGQHNGYGINGMAPDAEIGGIWLEDLGANILEAITVLGPGDIYNMSIQIGGPEGYMPVEYSPDLFAIIQTGAANGVCCLEAAGNGSVNLDNPLYGDYFDPRVQNSGAILCGAGTPNGLDGEWFTNYGERVSLQGWGSSVVTVCCGDLQGGDPEVLYTAGFSGTSSATPITSGSMASLQGQARALFGEPLTPALAEEILSATGTAYAGTKPIGERPNLAAARERLLQGFGDVVVTVEDAQSGLPMPNMVVEILETGRLLLTGPGGQVAAQLTAGDLTFHVAGSFYHAEESLPFTVEPGGSHEVTLLIDPLPQGSLAGVVRDQHGFPVPGARIQITATPIPPDTSGLGGTYEIAGIPENAGYTAIAGSVPTKGAAALTFDVSGGETTPWSPTLVDAQTFESGNANYAPTGEWEWGTPTWPVGQNRPIPFSGAKCWGLDLDGPYENLSTSILTSPEFDLTGTTSLTLSFHHWMWIAGDDGGQVQVWDAANAEWDVVHPVGGYPDDSIIILIYGPGYNGVRMTWEPAVFRLDEYAGGPFKFRLYFKSNYSENGIGWYVDDVALDWGQGPSAVDPAAFTASAARILSVGPNPTAVASSIRFEIPQEAAVRCEVFNPAGALIRSFAPGILGAGAHELLWDGRDDAGREVGNGLYTFRLSAGEARLGGKIVRIR